MTTQDLQTDQREMDSSYPKFGSRLTLLHKTIVNLVDNYGLRDSDGDVRIYFPDDAPCSEMQSNRDGSAAIGDIHGSLYIITPPDQASFIPSRDWNRLFSLAIKAEDYLKATEKEALMANTRQIMNEISGPN